MRTGPRALFALCVALGANGCGAESTASGTPASDAGLPDASPPDGGQPDGGEPDGSVPPLPDRPNFVFILGEAMGWTITSTVQDDRIPDSVSEFYRTPNLDAIAASGLRFSDFYAPSPRCMPSRASLLTGRSPAALHMTFVPEGASDGVPTGNVIPPVPVTDLPATTPTIASLLADRGYVSAHFGKWHAGETDPSAYGFVLSDGATANGGPDEVDHPNPVEAYGMTERAIAFMGEQVRAGSPFYLQVSHYNARSELDATAESLAVESERLAGEDAATIGHAAALRDVDITVGQLLAAIDELGIADRTYVLFSSDHGSQGENGNLPLTQGKGTVWEGGIRVPLFVRGPGIAAGGISYERASGVDLVPTMAELAQLPSLPEGLEGGSLVDLWTHQGVGTVTRPRESFVVHFPHYDKDPRGPASVILLGDRKLHHLYEEGSIHLFDLAADHAEQNDLAPAMAAEAAALDAELASYLAEVDAQMPTYP